jgi:hypothetical protein
VTQLRSFSKKKRKTIEATVSMSFLWLTHFVAFNDNILGKTKACSHRFSSTLSPSPWDLL